MVTTIILGMLCLHLLCFCIMFLLMSTRLPGNKMGMDILALGNLLLGIAYILQLWEGSSQSSPISILNHTLTLCAPVAYVLGAMRFFHIPTRVLTPLLLLGLTYSGLQLAVLKFLGNDARYALLAGTCTVLFLGMCVTALRLRKTLARDLQVEMIVFAALISGICALNAIKFVMILDGGMAALDMNTEFQKVFYLYMSFLATVLPPSMIWLVLRRLTDELRSLAAHDPLTQVLNRRGLTDALATRFRDPTNSPAYLLIVDIDHFKKINDTFGHQTGDQVLSHVANTLKATVRQDDLICRLGGEEFVITAHSINRKDMKQLAERIRRAIECNDIPGLEHNRPIRCTVTIGVSDNLSSAQTFDDSLQRADAALYRGKMAGRNRVEWSVQEQT